MPRAMHPWMNPIKELKLWPHDYNPIYEAYNRIFDCRGHGWANLQSMHINLPFAGDDEFGRLHAAIRLVLPILPAIAASSPFADHRETGFLDYRMEVYRHNSAKIPSITGSVIPEPVFTQADYEREIFDISYREIAPYDPDGILQEPFLNSRGAIARFERGAIEIRVIDNQECPEVDLAIAEMVTKLVQLLVSESVLSYAQQKQMATKPLANIFFDVVRSADQSVICNQQYLNALGMGLSPATARDVWAALLSRMIRHPFDEPLSATTISIMEAILEHGPLARRLSSAVDHEMDRLPVIYGRLCDCLAQGKMFLDESYATQ
jgi:gamma-glutamyl:cysteine ligase YbdK (ATP-grasp superfamily)